jgi:ferrous iron transport protein B
MRGRLRRKHRRQRSTCHRQPRSHKLELPQLALVGPPNVGKSLMFTRLTGSYAVVSNYPGTTVEVTRGRMIMPCCGRAVAVVDTPGMHDLVPISEEERVARRILLDEKPVLVASVVDAKNLERMLPLTFELIEAGFPVILLLNLMDEARRKGLKLDFDRLRRELGIPVQPTISTTGEGLPQVVDLVSEVVCGHHCA